MHRLIRKILSLTLALLCCIGANGCQQAKDAPAVSTTDVSSKNMQTTVSESTVGSSTITSQSSLETTLNDTTATHNTSIMPAATTTEQNTMIDKGSVYEPRIIVRKGDRILELWDGDRLYDSYRIGLGFNPIGHKQVEGDGQTPEGDYYVCTRNGNSRFYLSLGISYPSVKDAEAGLENGLIDQETAHQICEAIESKSRPPWDTPLGGEIMIHGHGSQSDWTAGCIAVDNGVMDLLWKYCQLNTPITIKP